MRRRTLLQSSLALPLSPACQKKEETTLRVFLSQRAQTLEGFGTSLIGWERAFVDHYKTREFADAYLQTLGASALRIPLTGDAVPERSRWQDIRAKDFRLQADWERPLNYLDSAKALHGRSGGQLRIIASVWNPPAWMKVNGLTGNGNEQRKNFGLPDECFEGEQPSEAGSPFLYRNKLRPDRYEHFAKSLVEWTRLYRQHGIELYGLSPQNEPRFSHWFGSAVYTPQELTKMVAATVRMFDQLHEPMPRLFAPETMTHDNLGNRAYLRSLFSDSAPGRRLHALATHGYVDGYSSDRSPESPARFYALARKYGKAVWVTEGSTGLHDWPAPLHYLGAQLINSLVQGQASLITPWQAVSKTPDEHALSLLSGPTKKTTVATHFFKYLRPGMRRVATSEPGEQFPVAAFTRASELVLVLLNRSPSRHMFRFKFDGASFRQRAQYLTDAHNDLSESSLPAPERFEAPPESISTLVFERA